MWTKLEIWRRKATILAKMMAPYQSFSSWDHIFLLSHFNSWVVVWPLTTTLKQLMVLLCHLTTPHKIFFLWPGIILFSSFRLSGYILYNPDSRKLENRIIPVQRTTLYIMYKPDRASSIFKQNFLCNKYKPVRKILTKCWNHPSSQTIDLNKLCVTSRLSWKSLKKLTLNHTKILYVWLEHAPWRVRKYWLSLVH